MTKSWRPSMDRRLNEDPELRAMVQEELEGMQIAQDLVRIRERHGLTQRTSPNGSESANL